MKEYEDRHVSSDDRLSTVNKELVTSAESNKKLQRDLKDALQLREELEQRVSQLEQRYVSVQRECSSLSDLNNRLETELEGLLEDEASQWHRAFLRVDDEEDAVDGAKHALDL